MICLQLYTKEVEAFPGESAASSLSSRHLNSQGGVSSISCKIQVAFSFDYHLQVSRKLQLYIPYKSDGVFFFCQFQDLVRRLCAWRDLMVSMSFSKT
jgi:hypothetical protein